MKNQKGFTLVELMISAVIGIFLMASLMNLFITTNKSITLSEALSQNQESGRFAMDYMTKFIRQAGYSSNSEHNLSPILINTPKMVCTIDACTSNNPIGAISAKGDRLAIPLVASADQAIKSCTGSDVGGPLNGEQLIANVFWVSDGSTDAPGADTENELRCRTYDFNNGIWLDNAVSIVANIESFEFQLGLAPNEDSRNAARYLNADEVFADTTGLLDANSIRSIRIALLTSSQDTLTPNKVQTTRGPRKYVILDGPLITTADDDSNLRQVFSNTIELPNMILTAN